MNGVVVNQTDPRYIAFTKKLCRRLEAFNGRDMDTKLFRDIDRAVERVRAHAVEKGLDLPRLVPFMVPSAKAVEVFRADATREAIAATIFYLVQRYGATPEDLNFGLSLAYPHQRGPAAANANLVH